MASRMINARAETIQEKPSFKQSFKSQRCLIPADGFIEWEKTAARKQPHYITLGDKELFAFAGIWSEWKKDGGLLQTFAIITTECNSLVQPIHHRMPVILAPDDYKICSPHPRIRTPCNPCWRHFPQTKWKWLRFLRKSTRLKMTRRNVSYRGMPLD